MGESIVKQIRDLEEFLGVAPMSLNGINPFKYLEWLEDILMKESEWLAVSRAEQELGRWD